MTEQEAVKILEDCSKDKVLILTLNEQIAIDHAVEAIKKQMPKKVKIADHDFGYFECPSCGSQIYDSSGYFLDHKFCLSCGQALDFSEDEQ